MKSSRVYPYDGDFDVRFKTQDYNALFVIYVDTITYSSEVSNFEHTDAIQVVGGAKYAVERINDYTHFFEIIISLAPESLS